MDMNATADPSSSDSQLTTSYELAGRFVEHLFNRYRGPAPASRPTRRDWDVLQHAVASATSLEQAVGRSIVVADLMSRGAYPHDRPGLASDRREESGVGP
jgi:hypothetical protein